MKMKRFLLMGFVALLTAGFVLTACKDDDGSSPAPVVPEEPEKPEEPTELPVINGAEWNFSGEAGAYELSMATTVKWKAESDADWLMIDPKEGEGDVKLKLTVNENDSGQKRTGTITVKTADKGELVLSFKVIQEPIEPMLKVTEVDVPSIDENAVVSIASTGGSLVVNVKSNVNYNFTMEKWTKVANEPSAADVPTGSMLFMIEPNLTFSARESKVTVEQVDGTFSKTFTLHQEPVKVDIQAGELAAGGGELPFTVVKDENIELDFITPPGLEVKFGTQEGDAPYTLVCKTPNLTFKEARWPLVVTLYAGGMSAQKNFYVIQKPSVRITAEYATEAGSSDLMLAPEGGETVIKLKNLDGHGYTVDFGDETGLSIKDQTADQFTLVYVPNKPNGGLRTGYFTVKRDDNPDNSVDIMFRQQNNVVEIAHKWTCLPVPLDEKSGTGVEKAIIAEIMNFAPSDVQFEYEIPAEADWITNPNWTGSGSMKVQRRNDDGTLMFDANGEPVYYMVVDISAIPPARDSTRYTTYNLEVDVAENTTEAPRSAEVIIKMYNYNKSEVLETKTITVTQPAKKVVGKVVIKTQFTGAVQVPAMEDGQPLTIELEGASEYAIYFGNGFSTTNYLKIVKNSSDRIQIFKIGNGPSGDFYIIPANESFSSANIENYGKVTLNL